VIKPRAPAGQRCPLWRKDVSKVCHACDWYRVIPVQDDPAAPVRELWGCAMVLNAVAVRSMHAAIDGLQAATESFRNEMVRREDRAQAERTAMVDGFMRLMRPDLCGPATIPASDGKKALT
jgi:hypothetical protein